MMNGLNNTNPPLASRFQGINARDRQVVIQIWARHLWMSWQHQQKATTTTTTQPTTTNNNQQQEHMPLI